MKWSFACSSLIALYPFSLPHHSFIHSLIHLQKKRKEKKNEGQNWHDEISKFEKE